MYELIILSLLMRISMHGYLIASIVNDIIGPYAKLSNGRLYPLLAKLQQSGLIEVDEELSREQRGERPARIYRITESGRKRFHTLMMDTSSNPGEYQRLFLQKVSMFRYVTPVERLFLIDHYINYCQAHVLHLTIETRDLAEGHYQHFAEEKEVMAATVDAMEHLADQWKLEVAWGIHLREREILRQSQDEQRGTSLEGLESEDLTSNHQHNQKQE